MGIMDDKGIIELYFARDENAISETMKSYNGRLLRFAMHFLSVLMVPDAPFSFVSTDRSRPASGSVSKAGSAASLLTEPF